MKRDEIRKTISLPPDTWPEIADIRFGQRFPSELDAVREIVREGIGVLRKRKVKKAGAA